MCWNMQVKFVFNFSQRMFGRLELSHLDFKKFRTMNSFCSLSLSYMDILNCKLSSLHLSKTPLKILDLNFVAGRGSCHYNTSIFIFRMMVVGPPLFGHQNTGLSQQWSTSLKMELILTWKIKYSTPSCTENRYSLKKHTLEINVQQGYIHLRSRIL